MWRERWWWSLVVCTAISWALMVTAGCKRSSRPAHERRPPAAVSACSSALSRNGRSNADYLAGIAAGCSAACPGLSAYARALDAPHLDENALWSALQTCDPACSEAARDKATPLGPADRFATLAAACGAEFYALPRGYEGALSDVTFVLGRIHQWLSSEATELPDTEQRRLDEVRDRAHIPAPPPPAIKGSYSLPQAEATRPFESSFYVVVTPRELRAASTEVVRLRGRTLELRPVPGGRPPGRPLPQGGEAAALASIRDRWLGMHTGGPADEPIAVLADGALPFARVLAAITTLRERSYRLAIAGLSSREHRVELVAGAASAAPVVTLRGGDIAFQGKVDGAVDALRAALIDSAPTAMVELHVEATASVAEVARALDVIDSAGGRQAMVVTGPAR